jgi:hypothetical protein
MGNTTKTNKTMVYFFASYQEHGARSTDISVLANKTFGGRSLFGGEQTVDSTSKSLDVTGRDDLNTPGAKTVRFYLQQFGAFPAEIATMIQEKNPPIDLTIFHEYTDPITGDHSIVYHADLGTLTQDETVKAKRFKPGTPENLPPNTDPLFKNTFEKFRLKEKLDQYLIAPANEMGLALAMSDLSHNKLKASEIKLLTTLPLDNMGNIHYDAIDNKTEVQLAQLLHRFQLKPIGEIQDADFNVKPQGTILNNEQDQANLIRAFNLISLADTFYRCSHEQANPYAFALSTTEMLGHLKSQLTSDKNNKAQIAKWNALRDICRHREIRLELENYFEAGRVYSYDELNYLARIICRLDKKSPGVSRFTELVSDPAVCPQTPEAQAKREELQARIKIVNEKDELVRTASWRLRMHLKRDYNPEFDLHIKPPHKNVSTSLKGKEEAGTLGEADTSMKTNLIDTVAATSSEGFSLTSNPVGGFTYATSDHDIEGSDSLYQGRKAIATLCVELNQKRKPSELVNAMTMHMEQAFEASAIKRQLATPTKSVDAIKKAQEAEIHATTFRRLPGKPEQTFVEGVLHTHGKHITLIYSPLAPEGDQLRCFNYDSGKQTAQNITMPEHSFMFVLPESAIRCLPHTVSSYTVAGKTHHTIELDRPEAILHHLNTAGEGKPQTAFPLATSQEYHQSLQNLLNQGYDVIRDRGRTVLSILEAQFAAEHLNPKISLKDILESPQYKGVLSGNTPANSPRRKMDSLIKAMGIDITQPIGDFHDHLMRLEVVDFVERCLRDKRVTPVQTVEVLLDEIPHLEQEKSYAGHHIAWAERIKYVMKSLPNNDENMSLGELRQQLIALTPPRPPHCLTHWVQKPCLELTRNYVVSILKGEDVMKTQTHHKKQCLRAMRPDDFDGVFQQLIREGRFNSDEGQRALHTARKEISSGLVERKLQYRSQRALIKLGANLRTFGLAISLFGIPTLVKAGGLKAYRDKRYETKAKAKGIFTSLLKDMDIDKATFESPAFKALRTTLETARLKAKNVPEADIQASAATRFNASESNVFKQLNPFVDTVQNEGMKKHLFLTNVQKKEMKTLAKLSGTTRTGAAIKPADDAVLESILVDAFRGQAIDPNDPRLPPDADAKNELLQQVAALTATYQKQERLLQATENSEEKSGITQFRPF